MTKRAKWWTVLTVAGLAIALGVAAVAAARRKADEAAARKTERPPLEFAQQDLVRLRPQRLNAQLALPGTIQAVSQATVRAKIAAEVKRVAVREGERVAAGDVLVEFDSAPLRAQLAERAAALEAARAQLSGTERTRQINAKLVKQSFISQNAFDAADSAHQAQLAAVAMAQAQLEQGRIQLADTVLRAPIAGLVARRHVQPGEKVGFDAPLLSIVDLSRLEVQAQAPVGDVTKVSAGMPAEIEVEGLSGQRFSGRVERLNPSAEPGTRSVHVYVGLGNPESLLRTGMFARVHLSLAAAAETPVLPLAAVRGEPGQEHVWLIEAGRLARRAVTTGARDERAQLVEIAAGLKPDESVLATRFDNLKEGQAARLLDAEAAAKMAERRPASQGAAAN